MGILSAGDTSPFRVATGPGADCCSRTAPTCVGVVCSNKDKVWFPPRVTGLAIGSEKSVIPRASSPGHTPTSWESILSLTEAEIQRIRKEACEAAEAESTSWEEVLANGQPVKIGVAIMSFQAACGINMVIFYSSEVFFQAGVDNSLLATVTVGIVNMAMTVVSMILVDRLGRKSLLVGGTW
eukprot:CAMPEP_0117817066 /NCGR_PEP_ID=MMETSP0949-20121206/417_1 /TAXON_ID=44440 /ORGANISM="Chattonella subsalsa, Strain CCMP2191" /LENGTH=181 /DNA_ID=CAMNT_0005655291 /DNA_START=44 /DNA_END=587 /DNA_ORIENTATION=+